MTIDYLFGVDFDQDGFVCLTCAPDDPLNILPTPLTHTELPYLPFSGATPDRVAAPPGHPYGQWLYRFTTSTGGDGVWFAGISGVSGLLPVTPGNDYRITFWAVNLAGTVTRPLVVNPLDNTNTAWETLVGQVTQAWQKFSFPITVPPGTTDISIAIRAGMGAPYEVVIAGLMLTEGHAEPEGFNVGTPSNRRDALTRYIVNDAYFNWGFWQLEESVSPPARLTLSLENTGGIFAFENPAAHYYGMYKRELIVQAVARIPDDFYKETYAVQFVGGLKDIQVSSNLDPFPTATLIAEDPMLRLLDAEYNPPLQQNTDTGTAIQTLFDRATIIFPYQKDFLQLGYSTLDNSHLFQNRMTDIDTGITVLEWAGSNEDQGSGVSAQQHIRDNADAELGGFFYYDAKVGKFAFRNRNYDTDNAAAPQTIEWVADIPPVYAYGDVLVNFAEVNYSTRTTGTPGSTLYEQAQPVAIQAGKVRNFTARYRDPNDTQRVVSGLNMITPVVNLDYEIYSAETGGTDVSASVGLGVVFNASGADVTVTNPTGATVYLRYLRLRGTPLLLGETQTARASEGNSIAVHGLHKRTYDVPALSRAETADGYAQRMINLYSLPRGRIEQVTVLASAFPEAYAWSWGTKVELYDPSLGNAQTVYSVHGIAHRIPAATGADWMTLFLRPYVLSGFWRLDESTLGATTRLAL